jgi:TolB-like protein/DNA-binding winged helix-turn-helix (wHTH) protein/Tfp pilus assembly protein PilF
MLRGLRQNLAAVPATSRGCYNLPPEVSFLLPRTSGGSLARFGPFEFDSSNGELRKHGGKIKLHGQPVEILALLLAQPGTTVTREELQRRLWPDNTFVDFESSLNAAVKRLRAALSDSPEKPKFVETLARRGYRFIAPVEMIENNRHFTQRVASQVDIVPTKRTLARRKAVLAASGLGLVAALGLAIWLAAFRIKADVIDSLAVLPFGSSSDPDAEYLSDGITESLINNLSQLPNVRVMARSTVFRYKGKDADPQKAGNDLHVHAVLSGRLLQHGNTLIVQAELMDVTTGSQIWGGQFNRKAEDVFALQEDLSREIAEKLRMRLTGDEKQRLAKRHTEDAEAYRSYLKGRYYWNKRSPEGAQKAVDYFQQAIDKDPAYALAYAGLADAYTNFSFFNVAPSRDAMPRAKAAATKALEIDDHLAEAHDSLGYISFVYDWDWSAAGKHFERALALNPTYTKAHNWYPFYLSSLGRSPEALAVAKSALDLDPASPAVSHNLAVQFYLARQFDQAIEQCQSTIEMDPNFAVAYQVLGQAYLARGMNREGVRVFEKYSALSRGGIDSLALLAYAHARLGERRQALRILEQLKVASKEHFVPSFFFALVYAGLEDKDQAFSWLEKGCEERFTRFAYLKVEALWDPLRSDQRFSDLIRRVGIPP